MYQYCKSCGNKYPAQNQVYAGSQGLFYMTKITIGKNTDWMKIGFTPATMDRTVKPGF